MNVMEVVAPWEGINKALVLSEPIKDEAHYEALLTFVEECFDRFGSDEHHPVFTLVDVLAERIAEYERKAHPLPQVAPHKLREQTADRFAPQFVQLFARQLHDHGMIK